MEREEGVGREREKQRGGERQRERDRGEGGQRERQRGRLSTEPRGTPTGPCWPSPQGRQPGTWTGASVPGRGRTGNRQWLKPKAENVEPGLCWHTGASAHGGTSPSWLRTG
jgi:hypothetical protein